MFQLDLVIISLAQTNTRHVRQIHHYPTTYIYIHTQNTIGLAMTHQQNNKISEERNRNADTKI